MADTSVKILHGTAATLPSVSDKSLLFTTDTGRIYIDADGQRVEMYKKDLDAKQNKLTGTAGQMVGFDTSGNAIAQAVPATGMTESAADAKYLKLAGGTMTGDLTLKGNPTTNNMAANKAYVDTAVSDKLTTTVASNTYLAKAGGTMTGDLTLKGAPSADNMAANKKYVDDGLAGKADSSALAGYMPMSGGKFTGNVEGLYFTGTWLRTTAATELKTLSDTSQIAVLSSGWVYWASPATLKTVLGVVDMDSVNSAISSATSGFLTTSTASSTYVPKAGTTMTGFLTLHAAPTSNMHAANKQYVDNAVSSKADSSALSSYLTTSTASSTYMPKSGGTFTGTVTLNGNPTSNLHAATKQYVDNQISSAITSAMAASY